MQYKYYSLLVGLSIVFIGCSPTINKDIRFKVKNSLAVERSFETVEIPLTNFSTLYKTKEDADKTIVVVDPITSKNLVTQLSDTNGDGEADILLFQPEIAANAEKIFTFSLGSVAEVNLSNMWCYSRFVPERTDDYAWENNRVAFRSFGPTAQKMVEDSVAGGTLSSGVDAWLKRVEYPIINKWYIKDLETDGSYHEDNGEGLDNFHVGISRGVGGIAVKQDSIYYYSKNYTGYKTIETGPIRTSFWLEFASWEAGTKSIKHKKYVSLDYGSNLSKYKLDITGVDTLSVGLTLHENDGVVTSNLEQNFISYWQPHADSEIGLGVVTADGIMIGSENYVTDKTDESNLYAHLKVANGTLTYYAGFGWKKSKLFTTKKEWDSYLKDFALKLDSPLKVSKQ